MTRTLRTLVLASATAAGIAARGLVLLARVAPGAFGAGAVVYGAHLAWPPLGFLALGAFLLSLDRRNAA